MPRIAPLVLIVPLLAGCARWGAHLPAAAPDAAAQPFLPGVISTAAREFGSAFSPDGRSL
jgi:hypothetical protein